MRKTDNGTRRGLRLMHVLRMMAGGLIIATVFALIFGLLVQYLWNWLFPGLFGFRTITFLQAFVLIVLSKLLFGGFGHPYYRGYTRFDRNPRRGFHHGFHGDDRHNLHRFWADEGKAAYERYVKEYDRRMNRTDKTPPSPAGSDKDGGNS